MREYWLNRISHEWDASYALLKKGYISIGWGCATCREAVEAAAKEEFDKICEANGILQYRSRSAIWNMAHYNVGDIVVVPQFDGMFSIYEVEEKAKPTAELEISNLISETGRALELKGKHLVYTDTNDNGEYETVDIGYVCKVKPVVEYISRAQYADAYLTARMKIRQTNAKISDLNENVEKTIEKAKAEKPLNFYSDVANDLVQVLLKKIEIDLTPDKVEELVKLYFQKIGATYAYIPAKNQSGKKNGADADVVAEFEPLKVVFYVQVKKHSGETSSWAVEQIKKYLDQMEDIGDDCTYIPWVITMADGFSEEAYHMVKEVAETKHIFIRLINGIEFAKMLLDSGLSNLDELAKK